jgi:hypothetical protein
MLRRRGCCSCAGHHGESRQHGHEAAGDVAQVAVLLLREPPDLAHDARMAMHSAVERRAYR